MHTIFKFKKLTSNDEFSDCVDYLNTVAEDKEIISLLTRVYVNDGYTDKSHADKMFVPAKLRERGDIILARSLIGELLGMIICVRPTSPARQVAKIDEAEIHLLAVHHKARCQGIASRLIVTCEQRAVSFGYSKIVLSTQQTMSEVHRVYEQLGYHRNPTRDWSKETDKKFLVYEKILKF